MTGRIDTRILLPVLSLALLLAAVFWVQPRAMSYFGVNLLFNLAVPIALATIAQLIIIMVEDIDLSIGTLMTFCAVTAGVVLTYWGMPLPLGVAAAIAMGAFCGLVLSLQPGDVISTGTPAGVGLGMKPPRFLAAGDVVRVEIDGIGAIENQFV